MERDPLDAELVDRARHVTAPVAAVQPLEPACSRLRSLRRGRGVAPGPLQADARVVPEVARSVVHTRIEDRQLEQPPL